MMPRKSHPLTVYRRQQKLSLADLATRIGVTRGHIDHIERRRRNPSLDLARRIAKATNGQVRVEDLANA